MDMRLPAVRLILAGAALLLTGLLLWWLVPVDSAVHHAALLARQGWAVRPARWLSALGGLTGMGPIALVAVALLVWRGPRGTGLWLLFTLASGRLVVEGIKLIVQRPRPPLADRLESVTSWSFPSSHSAGTMMTCIALAALWRRPAGWWGACLLAAAVGWSRIALGVHWPSDVLAGWGFGLLWIGAALRWKPPLRR
ncbi:phosphatase PAP2 family protein [Sphingomonas abietis]|uniref:Phosphatase PAP2 family protein n=1 Tax=Sphingomonas abietis TaxID=3012344 RepID=A0ABY7NLK8_9SPHN|nr:phosphatase PAP2 family protein [Sphingomonas abietis]WBO22419.1 phosphatase PAP2 family protein [Sphingomonas abietis]